MSGVPYPKGNGAYPTAKPQPIAASLVTEVHVPEVIESQAPVEPNVDSPVEPSIESFVEPVAEPAVEPVAEPATPETQSRFFPLVPTATSIYVEETEITPVEFDISSSLTREPQTNAIVLQEVPDALMTGEIITETGEVLITGSIELPPITGEMALVGESPEADRADETDSSSLNLTTVAPVRAPAVMNSKAGVGTIPSKHRRTSGQLMAMLTLGIVIVGVGSLCLMAAALGVLK